MRFRRLEVRAYRAIDQAELEFGPGLNVLYGPNDLGKSTLAAALRAVLLLPAESSAHQAFLPWHDVGPPKVRLSFERAGDLFRVSKVFGAGSLASSLLESSPDGSSFHEEERGRAVDRRLRELLRWGIEPPGGKSGARGLPESFLSQVLLGDQSDVPLILERSLASDRDASGRERLLEALQALSQDPVFKSVLSAAQAKVDLAFTPTGRRKTGQGSPFAQIKEQITLLAQEHERLTQQRRESEDVQQRILSLEEERLAIEAEIGTLEVCVDRDTEIAERLAARARAAERVEQAERAIRARGALRTELAELEAELAALAERARAEQDDVARADAERRAAEERAAAAERAAAERTGESARAHQASERARLSALVAARQSESAALERLIHVQRELDAAEAGLATELEALGVAERAEASLREALIRTGAELAELRELETVLAWRAAELAAERARAARADAERLDAEALARRELAEQARAQALAADVSRATLAELGTLARQIELAAARLDVGLALEITVPPGTELGLSIDGGPEHAQIASGAGFRQRARSRIAARLAGGIQLAAMAGDEALRGELEQLEGRWRSSALPLFEAHGVKHLAELEARVEAAREREREVAERLREADAAQARASEKRELGADLELYERRAAQLRATLEGADLETLQRRLEALVAEAGGDRSNAATAVAGAARGAAPALATSTSEKPGADAFENAASGRAPAARPARAQGAPTARGDVRRAKAPAASANATGSAPDRAGATAADGAGIETLLERRRARAEAQRARDESELAGLAAARIRALTRASSLDEARNGVRARRIEAWHAYLVVARAAAAGNGPTSSGKSTGAHEANAGASGTTRTGALPSVRAPGATRAASGAARHAAGAALPRDSVPGLGTSGDRTGTSSAAVTSANDATAIASGGEAARGASAGQGNADELGDPPGAGELRERLAAARSASDAAQAALAAWERQIASEVALAEQNRERAARALTEARARYDAVLLAGRELRERQLALTAQLAERRLRVDPAAESAARRELEQARAELESYGALEELPAEQLARNKEDLGRAKAELERVLAELRRAEGALAQVGGDVVAMRERQTQEALERARAQELEQEREYDAYRLLVEQLREVENEQGVHLGRALEAPVSDRFERLTEGRYRQVGIDASLGLSGVAVAGKPRAYGELSEGTQEQLATILRLCIAEYLETALVLDDHLAQTHRQRAEWFRTTLRESAARIQIIVLTARPEDYLAPEELCNGSPTRDLAAARVRAIDLERVIRRAQYGAPSVAPSKR